MDPMTSVIPSSRGNLIMSLWVKPSLTIGRCGKMPINITGRRLLLVEGKVFALSLKKAIL